MFSSLSKIQEIQVKVTMVVSPVAWWSQAGRNSRCGCWERLEKNYLWNYYQLMYQIWWIRQIWWCVGGWHGRSIGLKKKVSWAARTVARTVSGVAGQSHGSVLSLSLVAKDGFLGRKLTVPLESHQLHFQKHHTIFGQRYLCGLFEITFGHSLFKIVVSRRSHDSRNSCVMRRLHSQCTCIYIIPLNWLFNGNIPYIDL